jgi:asparagine synthase (glutamine-hydrolysing)
MDPPALLDLLREAVGRCVTNEQRVAVAYSGGLDSSLIAALASVRTDVSCYCTLTAGSADAKNIRGYADSDGCRLTSLVVAEDELRTIIARTTKAIQSSNPMKIAYSIPLFVVVERCAEKVILAGNGADELFAGYEKYRTRVQNAGKMMAEDLAESLDEAGRIARYADSLGKDVRFPYLENDVIAEGRAVPLEQKISGDIRKAILRDAARSLGLRAAERPKKAAQYSSGILKMMRTLARNNNENLSEWTQNIVSGLNLDKD